VLNGNVYFADWGGNVYSVNISNGNLNWEKNLGGVGISSSLALANGIVYVGDGQGETNVFALSQSTGNIIWSTTLHSSMNAIWASPIVYNGLVYIGVASAVTSSENNPLNQGEIFALNAQTGTVVWSFKTMIGNAGGSAVWGSVVIDPNLKSIFFGTGNAFNANPRNLYSYSIMSLDATTGSLKWYHQIYHTYATGLDKDFGSTPNLFDFSVNGVTDHAIGLGSKDGIYYILDRTSGALLNKFQVGNWPPAGIIGLAGFYYPSGTVNPEIFIPANYNSSGTNHGIVEAVKPLTHSVSWSFNRSGAIDGSVAVIPGAVLFGDISGNLYALSMGSGQQLFHTTMTSGIFGGITVAEGHVLVPTSFGSGQGVYAFSPN
jgi:outer membrane protein assembly factor BamB